MSRIARYFFLFYAKNVVEKSFLSQISCLHPSPPFIEQAKELKNRASLALDSYADLSFVSVSLFVLVIRPHCQRTKPL